MSHRGSPRRRGPAPLELLALGTAIVVLGWLGWDLALWDPRQQAVLHLVAAAAMAGLGVAALRGVALPRTPLDVPVLVLLAAFAAATASAANPGMSLRAMAAVAATVAMLPLLLVAVRYRPGWVGALASVPVLLLAIPTLGYLLLRRLDWVLAGAPGMPPLRLLNEGTPFGSVAVPPFVIWPAWALAGLIESPRSRRVVRTALALVGVPLTVLSGSRSAWLAMAVVLAVAAVPWAWGHRHRLRPPRRLGMRHAVGALAGVAVLAAAALFVVPRLGAVASLVYRAGLWRDTLAAWSADPLLGVGPGWMPYARQAAAPDFSFPVRQPHSHNLLLGVLGDAGIVGLVAAVVAIGAVLVVAGPWRMRSGTGRLASLTLLGLAIGGLFEDLTFLPNFVLLALALLAVALADAGAVRWHAWVATPRSRAAAAAVALLAATAVAPAVALGDAAAVAYRSGIEAWEDGDPAAARDRLAAAARLDPWHPTAPKALAVAADAAGDPALARGAAERAVALSPGDGPSWANLAVVCGAIDDAACQARAAERAAARASFLGRELANSAVTWEGLGRPGAADDAYRRSLLSQRLTAFGLDWPRPITIGELTLDEDFGALGELNRVIALWAADEPVEPDAVTDPGARALAHAMRGDRASAAPLLDEAIAAAPEDPLPWQMAIVLRDHWGEPIDDELRAWRALTGRAFPARDELPTRPLTTDDIASFRRYPGDELVRGAERLETDPIWPWVLVRTLP